MDRVGYRNMMETGITPMDDIAGQPVARSQLAARTEVNSLTSRIVTRLGLRAGPREVQQV